MLTISEMNTAVASGDAERLFPDDPIGPVVYRGAWWAVPAARAAFEQITDPAVNAGLDREAERLRTAGLTTVASRR